VSVTGLIVTSLIVTGLRVIFGYKKRTYFLRLN